MYIKNTGQSLRRDTSVCLSVTWYVVGSIPIHGTVSRNRWKVESGLLALSPFGRIHHCYMRYTALKNIFLDLVKEMVTFGYVIQFECRVEMRQRLDQSVTTMLYTGKYEAALLKHIFLPWIIFIPNNKSFKVDPSPYPNYCQ